MAEKKRSVRWRPWVRAIHRDVGYVAVGLTVIYALSGLAVNHIADWDPNFQNYRRQTKIAAPITGDEQAMAKKVLAEMGIKEKPSEVFLEEPTELEITLKRRTLHVNPKTGNVDDEGRKPRLLLRIANWLHLNRGKKSWTYFADAYAAGLLLLALSGIFMVPGRKGIKGRGAILVALGILLPVAYVHFSGGPDAKHGPKRPPRATPGGPPRPGR